MKGALIILWAIASGGIVASASSAAILAGSSAVSLARPAEPALRSPTVSRPEAITVNAHAGASGDLARVGLVTLTFSPLEPAQPTPLPEMPLDFEVLGSPLVSPQGEAPAILRVGVQDNEKVGFPFADAERNQSAGLARFIPTPGSTALIAALALPAAIRRRTFSPAAR